MIRLKYYVFETVKKYFPLEQNENCKIKILINLSKNFNKNKPNEIISWNLILKKPSLTFIKIRRK